MKAHVTLVNPPYPSGAPQSLFIPLGIGYLAAVLEKNEYEVDVIDCQVLSLTESHLEAELVKRQPDIVGVTSATLTYNPAIDILKTAKECLPNCLTIIGGPHVTVLDEQTLAEAPEADVIVRGEGEQQPTTSQRNNIPKRRASHTHQEPKLHTKPRPTTSPSIQTIPTEQVQDFREIVSTDNNKQRMSLSMHLLSCIQNVRKTVQNKKPEKSG